MATKAEIEEIKSHRIDDAFKAAERLALYLLRPTYGFVQQVPLAEAAGILASLTDALYELEDLRAELERGH